MCLYCIWLAAVAVSARKLVKAATALTLCPKYVQIGELFKKKKTFCAVEV